MEKSKDEFQTMVRGHMFQDTMLKKHMHNKEDGKIFRSAMNGSQDENALFGQLINNHKDQITTGKSQKSFNEVHRDRVPGMFWDGKLFQQPVGLVMLGFRMHTGSARLTIFLNKFMESGPSVIIADEINHLVLAGVSGKDVVMLVA